MPTFLLLLWIDVKFKKRLEILNSWPFFFLHFHSIPRLQHVISTDPSCLLAAGGILKLDFTDIYPIAAPPGWDRLMYWWQRNQSVGALRVDWKAFLKCGDGMWPFPVESKPGLSQISHLRLKMLSPSLKPAFVSRRFSASPSQNRPFAQQTSLMWRQVEKYVTDASLHPEKCRAKILILPLFFKFTTYSLYRCFPHVCPSRYSSTEAADEMEGSVASSRMQP